MGKPAVRINDLHICPLVDVSAHTGGPAIGPGVPNVLIGGMPAIVVGDLFVCVGSMATVLLGSSTVLIGGKPAARIGDPTAHGGSISTGCFTVLIGG
jgi:uncharacterized Zn-binding protein involved in type VI secretion